MADNKNLIDPMMIEESNEALEAKKQEWMDIFQRHPDFSELIFDLKKNFGDDIYDKMAKAHNEGKLVIEFGH